MGLSVVHIKELERVERSISAYSIRCVCYLHLFTRTNQFQLIKHRIQCINSFIIVLEPHNYFDTIFKMTSNDCNFFACGDYNYSPHLMKKQIRFGHPSPSGRRCECVRKIDDGVQSSQLAKLGSNAFLITKPASSFCKGGRRIIFFSFGTKGRANYQLLMQLKYCTHIYKTRAIRPQNSRTLKMPQFEFGILTEKLDNASPGR